MNKNIVVGLSLVFMTSLSLGQVFAQENNGGGDNNPHNNIPICHATESDENPYVFQSPNADSIFKQGHDQHHDQRDIIPPFDYVDNGELKHFPGLNWTPENIAFHANGCNDVTNEDPGEDPGEENPGEDPENPSDPGTPGTGGQPVRSGTSLANDNLQCTNTEFDAVFDVFESGTPVNGAVVTFTFNGATKEVKTNADGRAKVQFTIAEGTVTASTPNYPTQTMTITKPVGCPSVHLDPARGQVLGTSTMASTGSADMMLAQLLVTAGSLLTAASAFGLRRV